MTYHDDAQICIIYSVNNMSFHAEPSIFKLTSLCLDFWRTDSFQSFLRCSSWVIVLKFDSNKSFHFFLRSADSFSKENTPNLLNGLVRGYFYFSSFIFFFQFFFSFFFKFYFIFKLYITVLVLPNLSFIFKLFCYWKSQYLYLKSLLFHKNFLKDKSAFKSQKLLLNTSTKYRNALQNPRKKVLVECMVDSSQSIFFRIGILRVFNPPEREREGIIY